MMSRTVLLPTCPLLICCSLLCHLLSSVTINNVNETDPNGQLTCRSLPLCYNRALGPDNESYPYYFNILYLFVVCLMTLSQ
jgi:hypothetical protein